jgi:hypothetical protein
MFCAPFGFFIRVDKYYLIMDVFGEFGREEFFGIAFIRELQPLDSYVEVDNKFILFVVEVGDKTVDEELLFV